MNKLKNIKWKQVLSATVWTLVSCCTLVLLVSAVYKTDRRQCKGININFNGVSNHYFIDEEDIKKLIDTYCGSQAKSQVISKFDLRSVERSLEKDIWIKNAELYFDINGVLQVDVDEREPVARVFTQTGGSFYIDSSLKILPLSEKLSARVPVFTGFPTDTRVLSFREKVLLKGVRDISEGIMKDSFLMAMIDQVDITSSGKFELFPKLGDQVVLFGDASEYEKKFDKLKLFYKKVVPSAGWNKYSVINLSFENQVVAKIRSREEVKIDSLRTIELMKMVAEYTEKMAGDTVFVSGSNEEKAQDFSMILQSVQRDDAPETSLPAFERPGGEETGIATVPLKTVPRPAQPKDASTKALPAKTTDKKNKIVKPAPQKKIVKPATPASKKVTEIPKAVMKKPEPKKPNNDY